MDQEIDAPHGLEYICIWIKIQYNTRFPKHFGARLLLKAAADEDHKSHTMYSQSKPYTIFLILKTCWRCKFWPTKRVGFLCMVFQLILYWNTFCIWTISLRCSTSISDTFFFFVMRITTTFELTLSNTAWDLMRDSNLSIFLNGFCRRAWAPLGSRTSPNLDEV